MTKLEGIKKTILGIEKISGMKAEILSGDSIGCPILRVFPPTRSERLEFKHLDKSGVLNLWYEGGKWWRTLSLTSRIRYNYKVSEWLRSREHESA